MCKQWNCVAPKVRGGQISLVYHFEVQWLLYVPPDLTLKDFYVLPTQCTFVCFVRISEPTAIISLQNIKLSVKTIYYPTDAQIHNS